MFTAEKTKNTLSRGEFQVHMLVEMHSVLPIQVSNIYLIFLPYLGYVTVIITDHPFIKVSNEIHIIYNAMISTCVVEAHFVSPKNIRRINIINFKNRSSG